MKVTLAKPVNGMVRLSLGVVIHVHSIVWYAFDRCDVDIRQKLTSGSEHVLSVPDLLEGGAIEN